MSFRNLRHPQQQQQSGVAYAPAYPNQFNQTGAPLQVGSPLDGQGWGTPVWAWAIMFILALAITGLSIAILVKVCQIHPKKNASECYDGNKCTVDYKFRGGCFSLDCPRSQECNSTCYTSGAWSHCNNGECIGTGCIGQCEVADDCPDIATSDFGDFDTISCRFGRCIYEVTEDVAEDYATNCASTFLQQECEAYIDPDEPLKDCLALDTFCSIATAKKRSLPATDADADEEDSLVLSDRDLGTVARGCIFRFACAEVVVV